MSEIDAECGICSESRILYQCCSNKKDAMCEPCWSNIISLSMSKGRAKLLLKNNFPCELCGETIQCNSLPKETQMKIKNISLTIPNTKTPKSIEDFNYFYDQSNVLRHRITNEKFIFLTQRHYELLGNCLDEHIQSLMRKDPWNYDEIWLPIKETNIDDHHDQVNIFVSDDFYKNENGCLVLLQGSGVVRPGQWARSCCINDSLDIGSMFPYMNKAKKHNLSVIILNPNKTSYIEDTETRQSPEQIDDDFSSSSALGSATIGVECDNKDNLPDDESFNFYLSVNPLPRPITKKIKNLSTNREHVLYVYDHILKKSPAKKLYIVAHSAGGDGLMNLLRKRESDILPCIEKIAFTDSVHSLSPYESVEIKKLLNDNGIHFVASDLPMGEPIEAAGYFSYDPACREVSAGHHKHEYTSGYAVEGVFDFFFPPNAKQDQ